MLFSIFILSIGTLLTGPIAEASKIQELEQKKKSVENEKKGVQSELNEAQNELKAIKNEQERLIAEIQQIERNIEKTNQEIEEKNKEIQNTKAQIEKLKEEIKELEERIEKRNEILKDRARTMQETGGNISYLDVLLGSSSFSDFIDRFNTLTKILEADKEIINEHLADQEKLENNKKEVEKKVAKLEESKKQLESAKKEMENQKAKQKSLVDELVEKEQHAHEQVMSLAEQQKLLKAQEAAIQKAIELEKQRLAELERQKQNGGNNGNGGGSLAPNPNSGFIRPMQHGIVTSDYGPRWGTFHYGIDIGYPVGSPVYAAADGVVIQVQTGCVVGNKACGGRYGNHIYIYHHNVNGSSFTTVYAHLNSVQVSSGQVVKQGQQIGTLGNTGDSSGPHLHFEIHPGGWSYHGGVNPRNYISFPPEKGQF